MEALLEYPTLALKTDDDEEKMSSLFHSFLQSRISHLLNAAYENQYAMFTELEFRFASGKTRPDLSAVFAG